MREITVVGVGNNAEAKTFSAYIDWLFTVHGLERQSKFYVVIWNCRCRIADDANAWSTSFFNEHTQIVNKVINITAYIKTATLSLKEKEIIALQKNKKNTKRHTCEMQSFIYIIFLSLFAINKN